jgi:hypothetical protein
MQPLYKQGMDYISFGFKDSAAYVAGQDLPSHLFLTPKTVGFLLGNKKTVAIREIATVRN